MVSRGAGGLGGGAGRIQWSVGVLEDWGEMGIVLDIIGKQGLTHSGDMEGVHGEVVVGMVRIHSGHHYS